MAAQIICELPGDGCPECDRHEEHWLWAGAFANERSGMTLAELRDVVERAERHSARPDEVVMVTLATPPHPDAEFAGIRSLNVLVSRRPTPSENVAALMSKQAAAAS